MRIMKNLASKRLWRGSSMRPHNDLGTKAVLRKMWIKNAFSQHQQKGWCHVTHTSWHIFLRSPTLKIFGLKRYLLVACALGKGRQSGVHKGEWTWSTARTCTTTSTVTLVYHACTATTTTTGIQHPAFFWHCNTVQPLRWVYTVWYVCLWIEEKLEVHKSEVVPLLCEGGSCEPNPCTWDHCRS